MSARAWCPWPTSGGRHTPCILPAAEKTRSTPAEEAGAAKYCLTILASAGHFVSLAFHHASTSSSSRLLGLREVLLIEHRGRIGGRDLLLDAGKVELCECCVKNIFRALYHPEYFFFTTRKNPAGRPTTLNGTTRQVSEVTPDTNQISAQISACKKSRKRATRYLSGTVFALSADNEKHLDTGKP